MTMCSLMSMRWPTHLQRASFEPPEIGVLGFCSGGRQSFLVAARRTFGSAVGFYGGNIVSTTAHGWPPLIDEAATLQTPWLGCYGDQDAHIPIEDVERLRDALGQARVDTGIVRYADAGHGFHSDAFPALPGCGGSRQLEANLGLPDRGSQHPDRRIAARSGAYSADLACWRGRSTLGEPTRCVRDSLAAVRDEDITASSRW
jgi:dienelactone hydrolase